MREKQAVQAAGWEGWDRAEQRPGRCRRRHLCQPVSISITISANRVPPSTHSQSPSLFTNTDHHPASLSHSSITPSFYSSTPLSPAPLDSSLVHPASCPLSSSLLRFPPYHSLLSCSFPSLPPSPNSRFSARHARFCPLSRLRGGCLSDWLCFRPVLLLHCCCSDAAVQCDCRLHL